MYKLAGKIIDCYDDPEFIEHPGTVSLMGSELKDFAELEKLGDAQFAVKIASAAGDVRKFPVYNELITGISCEYFNDVRKDLPEDIVKTAGYHLNRACARHGVEVPRYLQDFTEPQSFHVKLAEEPVDTVSGSQEDAQSYFMRSVYNELPHMTPRDRVETANEIVKAAGAEYIENQDLWDYVPKTTYGPLFKQAMADRYLLAKTEEDRTFWREAERELSYAEPSEGAVMLEGFDKVAGYQDRYKDGFIDPYKACFGGAPLYKESESNAKKALQARYSASESLPSQQAYAQLLNSRFPTFDLAFKKHAEAVQYADMSDWDENYVNALVDHFGLEKEAMATKAKNIVGGAISGALTGGTIGAFTGPGALPAAAIGGLVGAAGGAMKKTKPKQVNHP